MLEGLLMEDNICFFYDHTHRSKHFAAVYYIHMVPRGKIIFINRTGFIMPAFTAVRAYHYAGYECGHSSRYRYLSHAYTRAEASEIYIINECSTLLHFLLLLV